MQLKLKLNGSAEPLTKWFSAFAKIRPSLLVEIDCEGNRFVAKTFTEDHSAVRYSAITFEECNCSVTLNDGKDAVGNSRIKMGLISTLPRLIKTLEQIASDTDETGKSNFDIAVHYDAASVPEGTDFVVTAVSFRSSKLSMKMDTFRIKEFKYLPDDVFFSKVFYVDNPVTFNVAPATIESIVKISDITKVEPKKDKLVFHTDGTSVLISDIPLAKGKEDDPNFTFKIGDATEETHSPIRIPFLRALFIQMMDKSNENYTVSLGYGGGIPRLMFESNDSNTRVVIGGIY